MKGVVGVPFLLWPAYQSLLGDLFSIIREFIYHNLAKTLLYEICIPWPQGIMGYNRPEPEVEGDLYSIIPRLPWS